ncbi:alpha/beta fold hydrolase [Rubrobacter aplysinae]|uniref:alpha/beta fold hydrolase n=1 Tax=Rubrobacter aplysinae TaxID=909625 RepID=UPI00064BF495|nr:alpha/beta hydrolase [Rubrobacter aplysinae]
MQSRSAEVEGIKMRWEEEGSGAPVVLVHGIPTSPRLWRHVVPRLEGARSLAWEMVGYGGSIEEGVGRDISVGRQAEYLASWMREAGLESGAVVCGHDLGGGVAQILAVRHPELVRGLVLTNCISYDSWPILGVRALRAAGPLAERMPSAMFRRVYGMFLGLGHDSRSRWRESVAEHLPLYEQADGAAALVRQARSLDSADTLAVADELPRLDVPARVVWGVADSFQPIGYGYRLAYELGGTLERVEGGRHFTPEDHPEPIARAISSLL